jgi:hypothetical protein
MAPEMRAFCGHFKRRNGLGTQELDCDGIVTDWVWLADKMAVRAGRSLGEYFLGQVGTGIAFRDHRASLATRRHVSREGQQAVGRTPGFLVPPQEGRRGNDGSCRLTVVLTVTLPDVMQGPSRLSPPGRVAPGDAARRVPRCWWRDQPAASNGGLGPPLPVPDRARFPGFARKDRR